MRKRSGVGGKVKTSSNWRPRWQTRNTVRAIFIGLLALLCLFVTFSTVLLSTRMQQTSRSPLQHQPLSHEVLGEKIAAQKNNHAEQRYEDEVYCMVPTIILNHKRWAAIVDGYGRYCDVVKFFIDPLTHQEEQEYLFTGGQPGKESKFSEAGMKVLNYPEMGKQSDTVQRDDLEFLFETAAGNRGTVVIIPMVRRKQYFDVQDNDDRQLVLEQYGSVEAYEKYFAERYHPIGICGDRKPCRHIWEKIWRSFTYVREHDFSTAHWFLKIDDDTFFIPQNLKKLIQKNKLHYNKALYFGHQAFTESSGNHVYFEFVSGVCSVFSRHSLLMMTNRYAEMVHEYGSRENFPNSHGICVDRDGATEERVTAKCLLDVGVEAGLAAEIITNRYIIPPSSSELASVPGKNYYEYFVPSGELSSPAGSDAEIEQAQKDFFEHLMKDVETIDSPEQVDLFLEDPTYASLRKQALRSSHDPTAGIRAELVLPLGLPFTLTYKRKKTSTSWYWKRKPFNRGDLFNCCSFHAYAIHGYKSSVRLREIATLIYDKRLEDVIQKFFAVKRGSEEWWYLYYVIKLKQSLVI